MKSRYVLFTMLLTIALPLVNAGSASGLVWGMSEGNTLDYELRYSEFSYNTMQYYITQKLSLHAEILDLPNIRDSIQNFDEIPVAQTAFHLENQSQTKLQDIVWMPDWYLSWQPLFLVLPIGNFELLGNMVVNEAPPTEYSTQWQINNTDLSSGYIAKIDGMGFTIDFIKEYSRTDGAMLEYSFIYDDLFIRSNFVLARTNLQEIVNAYTLQHNVLIWGFISGCMLVSMMIMYKWLRIRHSIHQIKSRIPVRYILMTE